MRTLRPLRGEDRRLRELGDGLRWWRLDVDGPGAEGVCACVAAAAGWSVTASGSREAVAYAAAIIGHAAPRGGDLRLDDLDGQSAASIVEAAPVCGLAVALTRPSRDAEPRPLAVLVDGRAPWAALGTVDAVDAGLLARSLGAGLVLGDEAPWPPGASAPAASRHLLRTLARRRGTRVLAASLAALIAGGAAGVVLTRRGQAPITVATGTTPTPVVAVGPAPPPPTSRPLPHATFGSTVVYDPPRDEVLVFGGVGGYDETWVWRPAFHWLQQEPPQAPEGRYGASAVFDSRTGDVVLFGGRLRTGQLPADTWVWNGRWSPLGAGVSGGPQPVGREFPAMAYDPVDDQVLLVTPAGDSASQTWVLRSGEWVPEATGSPPLPEVMAWDEASKRVVLVTAAGGGAASQTWAWDGRAWTRRADLPVGLLTAVGGMATDPQSGHVVLVASDAGASSDDPALRTWVWDGTRWADVAAPPAGFIGLAADVVDHELLAFTHFGGDTSQPVRDAWAWSGSAWIQLY